MERQCLFRPVINIHAFAILKRSGGVWLRSSSETFWAEWIAPLSFSVRCAGILKSLLHWYLWRRACCLSSKKRKQHLFERDRSVSEVSASTRNALQRKFHANPSFYNSKIWLFVAVATNMYLYSWKACLLLARRGGNFSQGSSPSSSCTFRHFRFLHFVAWILFSKN
jgi:hypothetical protein